MADDGAKGHDAQSNEHIESGVKLREVFFGKHSQGQGGRAGAIEDDKSCYRAEPAKGEKKKKE
ncbi:MAG: hypothetical protein ABS32_04525 [Verrucomicrobia subdivision 6 bacterium BACL9 MAG-120820-bin42]|uniref:Uncharacterized protein n=1 Tax=Verrucomicrobia subdivision 6 bacterium BACL9 MAG-120820-bin42 TaxID=1655634 RepID=A0A0R2XEX3_9BACT|nr:MAG: hypothetical protein ABS32_04525 [Verrucomicrobia subdivision 6 bacterium BACL9 MAG-120820-bin42]